MRIDSSKTRAQIQLQLRARALLFDKASILLFLSPNISSSSASSSVPCSTAISKLNPNYLKLHGDDVYFTLEDSSPQRDSIMATNSAPLKAHSKAAFGVGSRFGESEIDNMSQRLPETWYSQFFDKYKTSKPYRLSFGDRDTDKRTPEQMASYLNVLEKYKRRRVVFKENQNMEFGNSVFDHLSTMQSNSVLDDHSATDDETLFFPETMFPVNCVPDIVLPPSCGVEDNKKVELNGILDTLPQIKTRSPIMIERLGIRPEYLSMDKGGSQSHGKNGYEGDRKNLGKQQALEMSQKVIAHLLNKAGFETASEVSVEVFSQLLSCHICKLGRTLKVLTDSYRKQYSVVELIKMFLQTAGHSNLGTLAELVKDNTRNSAHQTQQQLHALQSQFQLQNQGLIRQPQQMVREMHPQLQHMVHPQNLAFQQLQQWDNRIRRRQPSTPRTVTNMNTNMSVNNMNMNMDKERPIVQVKIENTSDFPMDNAFATMNSRHPQLQFRQQQMAAMSSLQAQSGNQFRSLASIQVPQIQTQSMGMVRAPPVKVEGFQELMGGDASLKHDSEENKLTSPTK